MKDTIASLLKEEEELTMKAYGAPEGTEEDSATTEDSEESTATETSKDTEDTPTEETVAVTTDPKPVTDEPEKTEIDSGEDWEKRYKNLRSSRDQKLYEAKRQLAGALQTIATLHTQVAELQKSVPQVDPLEGVFTQEDIENLGDSTVEALTRATKKATAAATASLEKQLQEQRELRKQEQQALAERTSSEAYDIFLSRVAKAVPNWETINFEKGFEEFLLQPDLDGNQRKAYFTAAEAQGNAALIIRYMKEYEATKVAQPAKQDRLAAKVTPTGEDGGSNPQVDEGNTENVSKAFIDKFYMDISKGVYKGRYSEQQRIEAKIDKATMERRIVN